MNCEALKQNFAPSQLALATLSGGGADGVIMQIGGGNL